jgi:hypothetical protein
MYLSASDRPSLPDPDVIAAEIVEDPQVT